MEHRLHDHGRWWWAWTATHGWPRKLFRAWCNRNEYDSRVWHVGVMGFGYHLEVRFGYGD